MGDTFKQGAYFSPAGDAALTGELTQRRFQEEDGDPTSKQEYEVWNEEGTCISTQKYCGSRIKILSS